MMDKNLLKPDSMNIYTTLMTFSDEIKLIHRIVMQESARSVMREFAKDIISIYGNDAPRSVFRFVQSNVAYKRDREGFEELKYPYWSLAHGYGDCDDMVILFNTLMESLGYTTATVCIQYEEGDAYDHIYSAYQINGVWYQCDPVIKDSDMGIVLPDHLYKGRHIGIRANTRSDADLSFMDNKTKLEYL